MEQCLLEEICSPTSFQFLDSIFPQVAAPGGCMDGPQTFNIFSPVVEEVQMYTCPVCGFAALSTAPENHTICPSCGTQFGYSDSGPEPIGQIHAGLRQYWMDHGAKWQSKRVSAPFLWNPWKQLIDAKLPVNASWARQIVVSETTTYACDDPKKSSYGPLRLKVA